MTGHVPFDSKSDWANPYCGNSSNDPLVDKLIGNAYHVVRTVYCNLGNLKLIYDFLNQYGMVLGVQSEEELKSMTTSASYVRLYGITPAGDRQVTDYLYVEGDLTGIKPNDPNATGSWVKVATSSPGATSIGDSLWPWIYNNGSAAGDETFIIVPEEAVGVHFITIDGLTKHVGIDFTFDVTKRKVELNSPLVAGSEVVCLLSGVPANPDTPNISNWTHINWLYSNGAAVGGEQVIDIPYTFQSAPAIYKNGLRFYKGLANNSYTVDSDNNRIILTEPLATNDRLIVQLGGEANVLEVVDNTIQEVAHAANVKYSEVILSTDTTQVLNGKKVIFSVNEQKSYGLPSLPTNVYIQSVVNGKLTYNPGSVVVDLLPVPNSADKLDKLLSSVLGASKVVTASGKSVQEFIDRDYLKTIGDVRGWGDGEAGFNAAMTEMSSKGGGTLFVNEDILFTSIPIMHKEHVTVRWNAVAKVKTGLTADYAYVMDGGAGTPKYVNSRHFTKANKTNCYNLFLVAEDYTVGINAIGVRVQHCYGYTYEGGAIIGFNNGGFEDEFCYEGKASKFTMVVANTRADQSIGLHIKCTDGWYSEISPVGYAYGGKVIKSGNSLDKFHPWGNTVDNLVGVMGKMHVGLWVIDNGGFTSYSNLFLDTPVRRNTGSVPSRANGGVGLICDAWDTSFTDVLVSCSKNDTPQKSTLPMITTSQGISLHNFSVSNPEYAIDMWISFEGDSGIFRNSITGYGYAHKMRVKSTNPISATSGVSLAPVAGVTITNSTLESTINSKDLHFYITSNISGTSSSDVIVNISPMYGVSRGFCSLVRGGMFAFSYATTNTGKVLSSVALEVTSSNTAKFVLTFADGAIRYARWSDVPSGSASYSLSGVINVA